MLYFDALPASTRKTTKLSAKQPKDKETRREPNHGQEEYSSPDTDDYKPQPPRRRRTKGPQ